MMNTIHPDNEFPAGWTEIDKDEFSWLITHHVVQRNEFRQMIDSENPEKPMVSGVLFVFMEDETSFEGVGVTNELVSTQLGYGHYNVGRFFRFGCNHEFVEVSWEESFGPRFSHDHAYKCLKCGRVQILDSSD